MSAMTTPVTIRSEGFHLSMRPRVPSDQHGQQPEQYGRDHPGWLDPVARWQSHMQAGGDNDRQGRRPPGLAPLGR
jgi:hypothetical protein